MSAKLKQKLESIVEDLHDLITIARKDGLETIADTLDEGLDALEQAGEQIDDEPVSDADDDG